MYPERPKKGLHPTSTTLLDASHCVIIHMGGNLSVCLVVNVGDMSATRRRHATSSANLADMCDFCRHGAVCQHSRVKFAMSARHYKASLVVPRIVCDTTKQKSIFVILTSMVIYRNYYFILVVAVVALIVIIATVATIDRHWCHRLLCCLRHFCHLRCRCLCRL